jgi:hypothetical protein
LLGAHLAGSLAGLHRQHFYRVLMNDEPQYPRIEQIPEEWIQSRDAIVTGSSGVPFVPFGEQGWLRTALPKLETGFCE